MVPGVLMPTRELPPENQPLSAWSALKGISGVLLVSGVVWLALAALDYGYQLCNPSGSGCYDVAVQQFGNLAPLIFAPGVFLIIASVYLLKRRAKKALRATVHDAPPGPSPITRANVTTFP